MMEAKEDREKRLEREIEREGEREFTAAVRLGKQWGEKCALVGAHY